MTRMDNLQCLPAGLCRPSGGGVKHRGEPAEPTMQINWKWTTLVGAALVLLSTRPGECLQSSSGSVWNFGNDRLRIVLPRAEARDRKNAEALLAAFEDIGPTPGIDPLELSRRRITISLATQTSPGVDARSSPSQRLIILPLEHIGNWSGEKLRRVLIHEIAHIRLQEFLGFTDLPVWFQEGFAEWASGGLTCRGEVRIRLELMMRSVQDSSPPRLSGGDGLQRSRVSYDLFGTFFEYLEALQPGSVAGGTLLNEVRSRGVHAGLQGAFGLSFAGLERGWNSYLFDLYQGLPDESLCGGL